MDCKRVLIVDDEPRFAAFVGRVAEQLGFGVEVTHHGLEFQRAYLRDRPDVVVIDMVMPDIDGNELVLWLVDRGCEADIIIITGYHPDYAVNARLLAEYKGMRSVATLSKPVSIARLRQALMAAAGADAGIAAPDTEPDGEPGLQE
ncbi:MAG: response regulator [Rhodospirillales bacterium]|nr:response regulator [Rhodospirillales bacterium]